MRKFLTMVGTFAVTNLMLAIASQPVQAAVTAKTYYDV